MESTVSAVTLQVDKICSRKARQLAKAGNGTVCMIVHNYILTGDTNRIARPAGVTVWSVFQTPV